MLTNHLNEQNDRDLAAGFLRTGDEQVFREIYRRHTPALYLLALRLVGGSETDAQDLVQETWIRACRKLSGFEWRSAFRTWLSGILINCVRELFKETSRRSEEELAEVFEAERAGHPHQTLDLEKIIENLPAGYRHVLVLHDIEGYTHEEIGKLLKISAGTSKSQLFHARKSVRASLKTGAEEL